MSRISKELIIDQLRSIGLRRGDLIFVAADLMRVGYFNKSQEQTLIDWIDIFDEVLGPEGTIVVPAYSPSIFRYFQNSNFIFTAGSDSTSGSLARAYLKYAKDGHRGTHPTNSCIYKGALAEQISKIDKLGAPKYSPYKEVVKRAGKNLMLGIVDERNSPFTFHYAQEQLGHTRKHPFCGLLKTNYQTSNGKIRTYIQREIGGCTGGAHKAWGYHLSSNAVTFGKVGRSTSALVDAKKSAEIMMSVMTSNPHLMKCDDKKCISCYGRFVYNGYGVIWFYLSNIMQILKKIVNIVKNEIQ